MTQLEAKQLFDAIKHDDSTSFSMLAKAHLNISFGRFPLLTICFMYEAKKIIKTYFKALARIKDFEILPEPFELYVKFKSISQKSLRLYAGKEYMIMPIEMLAIQNKDNLVKKHFKLLEKDEKTASFLVKIYNFRGQRIKIEKNKIYISHKKLSKKTKVWLIASHSTAVVLASIIACVLIVISNIYGLGTAGSPKKIVDAQSFSKLSGKSCYATLLDDLVLDKNCQFENFSGTIIGNNKTITINYDYEDFLIKTLSGKIENVNIIFNGNVSSSISSNLSLLTSTNNGEISNVNILVNKPIEIEMKAECNFSGFANTNNKYIHDCSIKFNAEINSESLTDNFASFIANENNGTISGCDVLEESTLSTSNVDIAGIVNQNYASAEVSTCNNHSTLLQSSALNSWSPNVAGVSNINLGTISNCINYGNLTANNGSMTQSNNGIFLGGICSQNFSAITYCKNAGNLNSTSEVTTLYAGGITAYTTSHQNSTPSISFCASTGNFDLTKNSNEIFAFCGGISGFMTGAVSDCYSSASFAQGYDEESKNMIGSLVAASSADPFFSVIYLKFTNTHYLSCAQTTKTLCVAYTSMGYSFVDNIPFDVTKHDTLQEVQNVDIYW